MANTAYNRGRAYEYKAMRTLEAEGYTTIRTAGSHGEWDVVGFKTHGKVRCIQVKYTNSPVVLKRLLREFKPVPSDGPEPHFNHELWVWHAAKWHKAL